MRLFSTRLLCLVLACAVGLAVAPAAWAQVTTGSLTGTVAAKQDGARLPGAAVTAVHVPTGTRYTTVTQADGRFFIANVRVGGPYTVSVNMDGFAPAEKGDVFVSLGQTVALEFELEIKAVEEVVTVVGESSSIINPLRAGAESNVSEAAIETLPTINRGFEDFARTNPLFTVTADNDGSGVITAAGRNGRYNNIQIDGSVNNDLFGLADNAQPGGQAQTTPISLDAIQEIQLLLSPYDVRQGGFSGGGINAITRSGTNRYRGSAFYYSRDDSLVGNGPKDFPALGTFSNDQYGFRLGGPILKDKVFFFVNGERDTLDSPTGFSIDGSAGVPFAGGAAEADAERFRQITLDKYGFDIGGFGQVTRPVDSDKAFLRFDLNLADNHQLTLRHNYVDASNLILRPSGTLYPFPSYAYAFTDKTNSTVAQLNSVFSDDKFNELRGTYQTIKDRRGRQSGQPAFPSIQIENLSSGSEDFQAGTEAFSTENSLDQDIFELTDDFTLIKGNHTLTFGTHNEFFKFANLFIQQSFGAYRFTDLDAYEAGIANRYDLTYPAEGKDPFQRFKVNQIGLYAGDTWRAKPNLTLIYGLRVDSPFFPDKPSRNPATEALFGFRTDKVPSGEATWSPRVGFNWDIKNNGRQQLRGGAGLFSGRPPYVWISNEYGRTGIEQVTIQAFGQIPFVPDPFNQPRVIPGVQTSTQEVNLIDPNFKFPSILRFNLAYDTELPWWGLYGSIEGIYGETQKEILYQNLNVVPTGQTLGFDGRPLFTTADRTFSGAYLLTNTDEGSQTNVVVKIERPYGKGLFGYVSYAYGDSRVVNDGTSSRAVSNWQFNEGVDPNNPGTSVSDFTARHRFNASLSYQFAYGKGWATTVSAFWNDQSGRPYSVIYGRQPSGSINGDGFFSNDLVFVPASADDVIIVNGTFEQLLAFINADEGLRKHKGEIVPRNASFAPWTSQVDLHVAQKIPVVGHEFEITADILNVGNLIDSSWGHVRYANFGDLSPIDYLGVDQATGKPIYSLGRQITDPEHNPKFTLDNLRSRWQAKLGVRFTF